MSALGVPCTCGVGNPGKGVHKPNCPCYRAPWAGMDSIDRSRQYSRASNDELLRSLNEAWKTIRLNDKAISSRDKALDEAHQKIETRDKLIENLQREVDWKNIKAWIFGIVTTAELGLIAFLANQLFSRLH